MVREALRKARDFLYAQKYRFDLGIQFLVFVNFALLVITASDKLKLYFGINTTGNLLLVLIPSAFLGVWLFGFFLDAVVKGGAASEAQHVARSPAWNRVFSELEQLRKELKALRKERR